MANIKSKKKRIKTNEKSRLRNRHYKSQVHTLFKKAYGYIENKDKENALEALKTACRQIDKAVSKGVFHKNNAANKKSALYKAYNALV